MRADLALVGFGHVGQRFARLLAEQADTLRTAHDLEPRIVGIATRRHGSVYAAEGVDVEGALECVTAGRRLEGPGGAPSPRELVPRLAAAASPLRILVETTTLVIEDGQPAIFHLEAAIDAGCHAITANKGPVAFAYRRLRDRASARGVSFLFEGTVMDGVPVFNLVRETMPAVRVLGFRGVVNSTTNHILTALEDGEAFGPALARMQAEGIAEADASLDLDGWDAAAKAAALANVLMDGELTPHLVARTGIGPATAARARDALRRGSRLRLVASAGRDRSGRVVAAVRAVELPPEDLLSRLRGTANALVLHTDLLGDVAIHQLGGGLTATACALLSDLITIRRRESVQRGFRLQPEGCEKRSMD
jgi:homoserine dehydrogenase